VAAKPVHQPQIADGFPIGLSEVPSRKARGGIWGWVVPQYCGLILGQSRKNLTQQITHRDDRVPTSGDLSALQ
jgi:hypothetical protein